MLKENYIIALIYHRALSDKVKFSRFLKYILINKERLPKKFCGEQLISKNLKNECDNLGIVTSKEEGNALAIEKGGADKATNKFSLVPMLQKLHFMGLAY